jgi:hypothetical protein
MRLQRWKRSSGCKFLQCGCKRRHPGALALYFLSYKGPARNFVWKLLTWPIQGWKIIGSNTATPSCRWHKILCWCICFCFTANGMGRPQGLTILLCLISVFRPFFMPIKSPLLKQEAELIKNYAKHWFNGTFCAWSLVPLNGNEFIVFRTCVAPVFE